MTQSVQSDQRCVKVKCNLCPKSYKHKDYLRAYQRISHQGATKDFKCLEKGCNKSFSTNFQLSSHTLRYSKVEKDHFARSVVKDLNFRMMSEII